MQIQLSIIFICQFLHYKINQNFLVQNQTLNKNINGKIMKPIFKVLTSPFRTAKSKKSKHQSDTQEQRQKQTKMKKSKSDQNNQNQNYTGQTNIVSSASLKAAAVYGKVQKMVDQLGSMFNFEQKMSQNQKKQLIAELSYMALANNNQNKNQNFNEQKFFDNEQFQKYQKLQVPRKNQLVKSKTNQTDLLSQQTQQSNQNNQICPQIGSKQQPNKQLFQLFKNFGLEAKGQDDEKNQSDVSTQIQTKDKLNNRKKSKTLSFSSFKDIKSQMGKFWSKNSSKVLNMMGGTKVNIQSIVSGLKTDNISQNNVPNSLLESKLLKKKSGFSIGSLISSFKSKKQDKTLNSTTASSIHERQGIQKGDGQKQQRNDAFLWQNSNLGFQKSIQE